MEGLGLGLGSPSRWRRHRVLCRLTEVTQKVAFFQSHTWILIGLMFRVFVHGLRCGPSRERCCAMASHGIALAMLGLGDRWFLHYMHKALRLAEELGDQLASAKIHSYRAQALGMMGKLAEGADALADALARHHRWLSTSDLFLFHMDLANNLGFRGYTVRGIEAARSGLERLRSTVGPEAGEAKALEEMATMMELLAARPNELAEDSKRRTLDTGDPSESFKWLIAWQQGLHLAVETGHLDRIDHCIEQLERAKRDPVVASWQFSYGWLLGAIGRVDLALAAGDEARERCLQQLEEAVHKLRFIAKSTPLYTAIRDVCQAVLLHLRGKSEQALRLMARAEASAQRHDVPFAKYEMHRRRARIFHDLGRPQSAQYDLHMALHLCEELAWGARAAGVRRQMRSGGSTHRLRSVGAVATRRDAKSVHDHRGLTSHSAESQRLKRDRDALLEVSLAAATEFEPQRQAVAALDTLLRMLGAERAFLFLLDEGQRDLWPLAGRDKAGKDLQPEAVVSSVIAKVRQTHCALVLHGAEDAESLGLENVVATSELRSLICAPLMLRDRFTGVVYLDSSLARGVFTEEDLDILQAIAIQIAISQETTRSAQHEIERRGLEKDLQLSAAVQSLLLPTEDSWSSGGIGLCAFYEPAAQAGGDFWHATRREDGGLRVLLADVTGHGAGAAMVTALVAGCYRALRACQQGQHPLKLFEHLHDAIVELCRGSYAMTAALLELHPDGQVHWFNAGGPSILVQNPDGSVDGRAIAGTPLGTGLNVGQLKFDLPIGGRVLMFTDGVSELLLPNGRQLGLRRLKGIFQASHALPLPEARASILGAIRLAQAGSTADDDITFLLLERGESPLALDSRPVS